MGASAAKLLSFNPAMLAAVKAGRKTITRRLAYNPRLQQEPDSYRFQSMRGDTALFGPQLAPNDQSWPIVCPFGQPGSLLRVAEAPEIVLEILRVRAERMQAITEADAVAEGMVKVMTSSAEDCAAYPGWWATSADAGGLPHASAVAAFRSLIASIYPTAWIRNEWVWVIEFKPVQQEQEA